MGQHGPVPKRSEASHGHVTKETDRAANRLDGKLGPEAPDWLDGFALEWYESLRTSGQAVFYTDSDWLTAQMVGRGVMDYIRRPAAMKLSAVMGAMGDLCVTEGQRRRVRIELERSGTYADPDVQAGVTSMQEWVSKLRGGSGERPS
jgi:hypothetical protein